MKKKIFFSKKNIFFGKKQRKILTKKKYPYVLNFDEKNRDLKIVGGGGKRLFPPPLEKISLHLLFLVKNKKKFFFKDFKGILKNVARAIFDKTFCLF